MFTGIVEEVGRIKNINKGMKSASITIEANRILEDIKLGDSIATSGVCLTVTGFSKDSFTVDVMPETMRRSNLNKLSKGSRVNLERALRLSDRLGGHIVSGHIDGTGVISDLKKEENAVWISIKADADILKYIVNKGSIAVDGISLTVAYVDDEMFKVSIIPHTGEETTLLDKTAGDEVNLECDAISKYVEKLLNFDKREKSNLDLNFLSRHGFI